jgi:hypothetical protein
VDRIESLKQQIKLGGGSDKIEKQHQQGRLTARERIDNKKNLAQSIVNTVDNIDNVTLYFGVDDNDPTINEAIQLSKEYSFINIVFFTF